MKINIAEILEKQRPTAVIQTLILSKGRFQSAESARGWVSEHDFMSDKMDETEDSFRFRQREPGDFQDGSFRTIDITDGVKAVVGRLKERSAEPMEKKNRLVQIKAVDPKNLLVVAHVSTFQWDRTDERFAQGSWRLDNFKRNPVVMWSHDYSRPPIAKAESVEEDSEGLIAVTRFNGDDPFAMQIFRLYEKGFLSSFSVGFRPASFKMEPIPGKDKQGVAYTEAELLEYSAVAIPANPGATISREVADIIAKVMPGSTIKQTGTEEFHMCRDGCDCEGRDGEKFERSLKYLIDLCRIEKGKRGSGDRLSLIKNSIEVLSELHAELDPKVPEAQVAALKSAVESLTKSVSLAYGDPRRQVKKFLDQFQKALSEGRAE